MLFKTNQKSLVWFPKHRLMQKIFARWVGGRLQTKSKKMLLINMLSMSRQIIVISH